MKDDQKILDIESELESLLEDRNLGFSLTEGKNRVIKLDIQKDKILKEREEAWRLKSRVFWLKAGYDNTRFFQNYAKGRKVTNTIWKLPLPNGELADNCQKLSKLGTTHFQNLFRAPQEVNLVGII